MDDQPRPRAADLDLRAVCAANPRTVVVPSNGSPVLLPWRDRPAAIVEGYLGRQASGAALVADFAARLGRPVPTPARAPRCSTGRSARYRCGRSRRSRADS